MFDIDFGLAAAERQRENDLPHKKTLYHCDSCGGEISEGEACYYNGYTEKWYCDGCVRKTTAERDELPLYHCDSCGGEIYEGEECYYCYKDVWICSDCIRSTFAEN